MNGGYSTEWRQVNNVCLLLLASSFWSSLYGYDVGCQVFEKAGVSTKVSGRTLPAYRIANRGLQFCKRITAKKSCTSLSHSVSNSNISNVVTYRNQVFLLCEYKSVFVFRNLCWIYPTAVMVFMKLSSARRNDGIVAWPYPLSKVGEWRWTLSGLAHFFSGWWWKYWSARFLYYELILNRIIIQNIATGRTHN